MESVGIAFAKGHGTGNDFVILPDDDGVLELSSELVRRLADRHQGIGGDGVLRVLRTRFASEPAVVAMADQAEWFMDYRNADGSLAEMCGNGVRVFAHFLLTTGRASGHSLPIATRGGVKLVRRVGEDYAVSMGKAHPLPAGITVSSNGRQWPAIGVTVPNPHAVAFVDKVADAGPLLELPKVDPEKVFPAGVNYEFVEQLGERHVRIRIHERGVGETQSCGTGACAVAWASRRQAGVAADAYTEWQVDVPGGTVWVSETADGEIVLRGPAAIVAAGEVDPSLWSGSNV